jgi:hypothetical protein
VQLPLLSRGVLTPKGGAAESIVKGLPLPRGVACYRELRRILLYEYFIDGRTSEKRKNANFALSAFHEGGSESPFDWPLSFYLPSMPSALVLEMIPYFWPSA